MGEKTTTARPMPPTKPPANPLEEEIAHMLWAIETNYAREGTGHGSRFAGERLEVVQARAVINRMTGGHHHAAGGPWVAVLADEYGWPRKLEDFEPLHQAKVFLRVAVVRDTAAPTPGGQWQPQDADVLYEAAGFTSVDDLTARWTQARLVAALLSAAATAAEITPRRDTD